MHSTNKKLVPEEKHQMIEINLNAPTTPEERQSLIVGNVSLGGKGATTVPFMDDNEDIEAVRQQQLSAWPSIAEDKSKSGLRYYSVGPSSYQIRCPLCRERADTETVQMSGILGQLSCCLSTLSCCFPIFSLSFVYLCLQSRLKSKRLFCNRCGGHLGYYWRPT